MKKLLLLIGIIAGIGCQQSHADKKSEPTSMVVQPIHDSTIKEHPIKDSSETPYETLADEFADREHRPAWMDSCLPALYPDTWLDTVMAHPKISRFNADDDCVLATINMLEAMLISDTCKKCMTVFNAVVAVSDGYVGEAITDVAGNLYSRVFESLIKSLADTTNNSREQLLDNVVWSFYYKLPGNKDEGKKYRDEVIADIRKKILDKRRTEAERQVLVKLEQKVKDIIYQEYGY